MFADWQRKRLLAIRAFESRFYPCRDPVGEEFMAVTHAHLKPGDRILHAGCGADTSLSLRGKCKEVVGIDLGRSVLQNQDVDTPIVGDLAKLDLSLAFDLVVCKDVVEHLKEPLACFHNFSNVLKDGGLVIIGTPNILHYGVMATKLTSHKFHQWFLEKILNSEFEVAFPTYYRANHPRKLCAMMAKAGFRAVEIRMVERPPDYLFFTYATSLTGIAYERVVSRFKWLELLRCWIIGVFQLSKH